MFTVGTLNAKHQRRINEHPQFSFTRAGQPHADLAEWMDVVMMELRVAVNQADDAGIRTTFDPSDTLGEIAAHEEVHRMIEARKRQMLPLWRAMTVGQ